MISADKGDSADVHTKESLGQNLYPSRTRLKTLKGRSLLQFFFPRRILSISHGRASSICGIAISKIYRNDIDYLATVNQYFIPSACIIFGPVEC
jgi:hypothetical protein